jgi:hypothetical protein
MSGQIQKGIASDESEDEDSEVAEITGRIPFSASLGDTARLIPVPVSEVAPSPVEPNIRDIYDPFGEQYPQKTALVRSLSRIDSDPAVGNELRISWINSLSLHDLKVECDKTYLGMSKLERNIRFYLIDFERFLPLENLNKKQETHVNFFFVPEHVSARPENIYESTAYREIRHHFFLYDGVPSTIIDSIKNYIRRFDSWRTEYELVLFRCFLDALTCTYPLLSKKYLDESHEPHEFSLEKLKKFLNDAFYSVSRDGLTKIYYEFLIKEPSFPAILKPFEPKQLSSEFEKLWNAGMSLRGGGPGGPAAPMSEIFDNYLKKTWDELMPDEPYDVWLQENQVDIYIAIAKALMLPVAITEQGKRMYVTGGGKTRGKTRGKTKGKSKKRRFTKKSKRTRRGRGSSMKIRRQKKHNIL